MKEREEGVGKKKKKRLVEEQVRVGEGDKEETPQMQ